MKLFMKVTKDEYELPLAVADSAAALARILRMNEKTVYSAFRRKQRGWAVVETEEE